MIRGVNLGGWLVLEKWITPAVFEGTTARDEFTLCEKLGEQASDVLRVHRDNFITEADFRWLQQHGVTAVRLPVGYWVFGDEKPYVGAIEYVDKAFEWAEANGLKILLDLHTAPGSQNGYDHSGRIGDIGWHTSENMTKTLATVERLAKRYKGRDSLLGIELINEPSWLTRRTKLREYYEKGYEKVRAHCGTNVAVVVSDAFHPTRWRRVMQSDKYQRRMLDIHLYQLFNRKDIKLSLEGHLSRTAHDWAKMLKKVSKHWPIVIGEWSAALPEKAFKDYSPESRTAAIRAYASGQLAVFERYAVGWFYWTYRTQNGGVWSYRWCVEQGILPSAYPAKRED
jgi:glucan 1,3-beta-glucosidase